MWLTIEQAARHYGYSSADTLQRRLRQLRERGQVHDMGDPPEGYRDNPDAPVRVLWAHPKAMLVADDAPRVLLDPSRGRR